MSVNKPARLELLEQLIAKGSNDPFVFYARAMELRSQGRPADALVAFADVAARFPDYVPTFLMAAQVAREIDDTEGARDYAERGCVVAERVHDEHALGELRACLGSL